MAYTKQTWADLPSKTTPINATRLGHIEDGIYNAAATADTAASTAGSLASRVGIAEGKITNLEQQKVDKETGKGLSENDFTNTLKSKLDGIASGAEVNVQSDWDEDDSSSDAFILNKPTLGTASTKNSTSVVTDSTDLVESGAVYDALGFGNKNLIYTKLSGYNVNSSGLVQTGSTYSLAVAKVKANKEYTVSPRASFTDTNIVFAFFVNEITKNSVSYNNARTVVSTEDNSYTFTAPIDGYVSIRIDTVDSTIQLEKGSTATAYEPYHASVEETIPQVVSDAVGWDVGNLFDKSTATTIGYLNADGTVYTQSDWRISDYIPVKSGLKITISGVSGNLPSVCFYDANKVYVSGESYSSRTTINKDIPVGVGYIRISVQNQNFDTASVKYVSVNEQKADNSVIAPVENGTTASQAYAVGSHAIRNGAFITWKNAKAQGETINDASDYTSGDVADELDTIDITSQCTFSTDCTWNTNWTHLYKKGDIIFGSLRFTTPTTATSDKAIIILPTGLTSKAYCAIGVLSKVWESTASGVLAMFTDSSIRLIGNTWQVSTEVIANIIVKLS